MRRAAWVLAVVAACLAGCGVKGALYLPEKPSEVIIRPAPGTEPTAEQPQSPPAEEPEAPRD
jgi:predicted small lipoprotein YifL